MYSPDSVSDLRRTRRMDAPLRLLLVGWWVTHPFPSNLQAAAWSQYHLSGKTAEREIACRALTGVDRMDSGRVVPRRSPV
jgi:hypothetical protein